MKNNTTLFAFLLLFSIGFWQCASDSGSNDENTTQEEPEANTEENNNAATYGNSPSTSKVLNPNIDGADAIADLPGMTAEIAKKIEANRPFLNMTALNDLLKSVLNEEQLGKLYANLFVPINLNTASEAEMMLVPGVGKKLAHEFEEYRPYAAPEQFRREMGKYIDDDEINRIEKYVFVPVNVNTASDEQIKMIPGVGDKMLHEFKEYRPFKNRDHFNREIGKYVDDKELARLGRYITIEESELSSTK